MRLLFLGLGHLSNGDISIAADFARQLPPNGFDARFVTATDAAAHVRGLGLAAYPLESSAPRRNLETVDQLVADFRPDLLVAADAFTLNYSTAWSGLSMAVLRDRYPVPLASFDQYDYPAAGHVVDFYGGHRTRFPRLLDDCDLVIRNSPLNRPAPNTNGLIVTRMRCATVGVTAGVDAVAGTARRDGPPVVFLVNSRWEYLNVLRSPALARLMRVMPGVVHSHLAALGRPLRVVHVGPVPWQLRIADHIDYRYEPRLAPALFHEQLTGADLFLTTNAASVTLTQAVLAGVPSLLLQNHRTLDVARLAANGGAPAWLAEAAPGLAVAYPFRVFPWGWYEFLGPVLSDNPYTDCFLTVGAFERSNVLRALAALLDDRSTLARLDEARWRLEQALALLPSAADTLAVPADSR